MNDNRIFESADDLFGSAVYSIRTAEIAEHVKRMRDVGYEYPDLVEGYDFYNGTEYATLVYADNDNGDYADLAGCVAFVEVTDFTIENNIVSTPF